MREIETIREALIDLRDMGENLTGEEFDVPALTALATLETEIARPRECALDDWQPIETIPAFIDVLLCAKPEGYQSWKYGVGSFFKWEDGGFWADWPWAFSPTHWQVLKEPAP